MLTRRFRAPQTLAVLTAATGLLRDAHPSSSAAASGRLQTLRDAIEEVEPLTAQVSHDEELEDAV